MSYALATNVLVNQQLPNNCINSFNQTYDHDHLQPLQPIKCLKSSSIKQKSNYLITGKETTITNYCNSSTHYNKQSASENIFSILQTSGNKRANCMQLTDLDSINAGPRPASLIRGAQQQQQQQTATCQNHLHANPQAVPDQACHGNITNDSSYNCPTSVGSKPPTALTKHNTDINEQREIIRRGVKRTNDTDRDSGPPVIVERAAHCDLASQSGQQATNKALDAQGSQGEADDSDEDSTFDYEIVLTKILNEKKLALSNSPEVLKFLSSNRREQQQQQQGQSKTQET